MTQQYGFRAARNLAEVQSQNDCIDNLGIDRRDLALLVGTSAAGVTEADYQAIIGLSSNLEQQIVALSSGATVSLSGISARASRFGDTFTGPVVVDSVNNDRPYTPLNGTIIGPSTASFFSPTANGLFSSGGEYKLGPVTAGTVTNSGLNYTGTTQAWSNRFINSGLFARVQEQPSWTVRRIPLFLPPPFSLNGCVLWLDAEFSDYLLADGTSKIAGWKGVDGGVTASQSTSSAQPTKVDGVLSGKPAVRFAGASSTFLTLGNLGYLVPTAATVIIRTSISDSDYNIFGTLNNAANRWNAAGSGVGAFGVFTTTVQTGFPVSAETSGTFTFSIRASQSYGLQVRKNGTTQDYKASGFTYTGGDSWRLGASGGSSGFFDGDIFAMAVFNRVLSDKEVATVEQYFTRRYATP
jgi:hypothetical protein